MDDVFAIEIYKFRSLKVMSFLEIDETSSK